MAGLILLVEWVVSATTGWLGFWLWLIVPPFIALFISFSGNGRALDRLKEIGVDAEGERQFVKSVMGSSLKFVAWQAIVNLAIFLAAFGLHHLF